LTTGILQSNGIIFKTLYLRFVVTKKYIILGIAVIVLISLYLGLKPGEQFLLYKIVPGKFLIDIETQGVVKAINSYVVNAPSRIWGNIQIIKMVDEGARVNKGDFLIQFDTAEFQERLQSEENKLETNKAELESRQANIKQQMTDLENQLQIEEYNLEQMRLQAKNAIYEAENKRKEIEYSLKKSELTYLKLKEKIEETKKINEMSLRQVELRVQQQEIDVKRVRTELEQLTINSPANGLVVYKEIRVPGGSKEKVKVGSSPWRNQPLMEIPDQSEMKVVLTVNEVDISQIKKEQNVNIKLDAIVDSVFTGKITKIAALAHEDDQTEKKVFDVEVNIREHDERLKPGMSAGCQIIIEELKHAISVPIDAVTTIDGQSGVYSGSGDFLKIETGKSNSDFIIVEKGLQGVDEIRLKKEISTEQVLPGKQKKISNKKPNKDKPPRRMPRRG